MQECSDPVGRLGIIPPGGCHWHYFKTWPGDLAITHRIVEPSGDKGSNVLQIIQGIDRVRLGGQGANVDGWRGWLPSMTLKDVLWIIG